MHYAFTTEETVRRAEEIVSYLLGPRLWMPRSDYPDIEDWAHRTFYQLRNESKRAVVALLRGSVIGVVVYQRHRDDPWTLEIKNVTVRPDQRGRRIASFLLRNAEAEGAADFVTSRSVTDAKASNLAVRAFLLREGYLPSRMCDLYGLGAGPDVVYEKALRPPRALISAPGDE